MGASREGTRWGSHLVKASASSSFFPPPPFLGGIATLYLGNGRRAVGRDAGFCQNMRRLEEREGPKCAVKSPTKNNFEYRIEAAVSWMGGRIEINRLGCCRDLT